MKRKKRDTKSSFKFPFQSGNTTTNTQFHPSVKQWWKRKVYWISIIAILAVVISGGIFIYNLSTELVSLNKLERIDPAMASQVYSADGKVLHSFFRLENRKFTPYERLPQSIIDALISSEDRKFRSHWGIDMSGIARAIVKNIMQFDLKGEGASTITMQLARNLYYGYKKKWTRKIKEALTAIQIERTYSKNEILEMYLNVNSFGNNAFGIQAAARRYFDKTVQELNTEESALLIGVLKGQSYYSPISHPDRAVRRRNIVLQMMMDNGRLTRAEYDSLRKIPLKLKLNDPNEMNYAPYFTEYVRRQLNRIQDSLGVDIYEDGLRIYTSVNTEIQEYMELAVERNIDKIQERVRNQRAFREYKETLSDSAFKELTMMQIAFVCINPHTGHILAMIGGRDFEKSKWNRVTQMKRQPGSAFKPFLYTAAIDNGYTPADVYLNQPTVEINPDGTRWTPKNYNGDVGGFRTLRDALRNSKNLIAVRLISDITPQVAARYAHNMGITTQLRPFSSLALGSSEVIPLELVSAYGTFATGGIHIKPISILKIDDKHGNTIYQPQVERREVLSPETAYIMNDMLQDVVNRGTGYHVRSVYKFYHQAGGKTGTTNDNTNAWFVGFTPDMVAGVWVGMDDLQFNLGTGMAGAVAALPFWATFMKTVYDSVQFKQRSFPKASGIVRLNICTESRKLAGPYCPESYEEIFRIQYKPDETCEIHEGPRAIQNKRRKRF